MNAVMDVLGRYAYNVRGIPQDEILLPEILSRRGSWKYYRKFISDNASFWPLQQGPFLFDLDSDPNKSYSLVKSMPGKAVELAALLDDFEADLGANLPRLALAF